MCRLSADEHLVYRLQIDLVATTHIDAHPQMRQQEHGLIAAERPGVFQRAVRPPNLVIQQTGALVHQQLARRGLIFDEPRNDLRAELLDNLETTIRERFALQREMTASTSQAKLSGLVMSMLPIFVSFFIYLINPEYILFLFEDPAVLDAEELFDTIGFRPTFSSTR